MDPLERMLCSLPVLKETKSPVAAMIIGFLFGGLGLAIYFRKIVDFFIPVLVAAVLSVPLSLLYGQGMIIILCASAAVAAYGYLRASSSNKAIALLRTVTAPNLGGVRYSTALDARIIWTRPRITAPTAGRSSA